MTKIEVTGDERTRTLSDNVIDLDGVKLITSPLGVGVDFTCNYDTAVNVQSGAFTVEDVSIFGTQSSIGSLDDGFTFTAGDGTPLVLGNDITIKTTWSVVLSDVSPHYESCSVIHGDQEVPIVKDGCMASTLGGELVANTAGVTNEVSMKYKTFNVENETAATQSVTCNVKLCASGYCAKGLAGTCSTASSDTSFGSQKDNRKNCP